MFYTSNQVQGLTGGDIHSLALVLVKKINIFVKLRMLPLFFCSSMYFNKFVINSLTYKKQQKTGEKTNNYTVYPFNHHKSKQTCKTAKPLITTTNAMVVLEPPLSSTRIQIFTLKTSSKLVSKRSFD